jgi:hypothetical protein
MLRAGGAGLLRMPRILAIDTSEPKSRSSKMHSRDGQQE